MPQEMKVRSVAEAAALAKRIGGTLRNDGGSVVYHPEDARQDEGRAATAAMTRLAEQISAAVQQMGRSADLQSRALVMLAGRDEKEEPEPPEPEAPEAPEVPCSYHIEIVRDDRTDLIRHLILRPFKE